ncbi:MAG: rhodanese-like domain-containing protein [Pseudomonadota bacterium]|nr:rhodanese-like domain-containing protein [Pseudomonadota bacterium]
MRQILGVIASVLLATSGASASHNKHVGEPMVLVAKNLIAEGQVVIDVRQEACDGYVKGAHIISIDDFSAATDVTMAKILKLVNDDKTKSVAVYCKSGVRSKKVMGILKAQGFSNLHNLGGVGEYYDPSTMQKCD